MEKILTQTNRLDYRNFFDAKMKQFERAVFDEEDGGNKLEEQGFDLYSFLDNLMNMQDKHTFLVLFDKFKNYLDNFNHWEEYKLDKVKGAKGILENFVENNKDFFSKPINIDLSDGSPDLN